MPVCVPIKDLRDTARFSQLVETSEQPITVTKNGYSRFVVMRTEDYDALRQQQARANLLARIALSERERAAGSSADAFESLDAIEARYGL